jgi:hypothetical protein
MELGGGSNQGEKITPLFASPAMTVMVIRPNREQTHGTVFVHLRKLWSVPLLN